MRLNLAVLLLLSTFSFAVEGEQWRERIGLWVLEHDLQLFSLEDHRQDMDGWALIRLHCKVAGSWNSYLSLRRHLLRAENTPQIESESISVQPLGITADIQLAFAVTGQ